MRGCVKATLLHDRFSGYVYVNDEEFPSVLIKVSCKSKNVVSRIDADDNAVSSLPFRLLLIGYSGFNSQVSFCISAHIKTLKMNNGNDLTEKKLINKD